jgi:RNA processing factor Prp31
MEANPLYKRPWDIAGRFDTFEQADRKRSQLKERQDLQVKVKKLKENYVVKVRSTIVEKKKEKKKEKKRGESRRRDKSFYMLENYKAVNSDS